MDFLAIFTLVFEKVSILSCHVSFAPFMLRLSTASMETAGMMEMVENCGGRCLDAGQESGVCVFDIHLMKT